MEQQLAYCTAVDGVRIAYATYGNDDAPPLVHTSDVPGQEAIWASPWGRACFQALARQRRLVTLDHRGRGGSARGADCSHLELLLPDVAAVADHLKLDRFELFADRPAHCALATMYTQAYAERVSKLVLFSPMLASSAAVIATAESARASYAIFARSHASILFPSGPPDAQRWFSTTARSWGSGDMVAQTVSWIYDLSPILPRLSAPVLVLHRKHAQICGLGQVRSVAALIPDGRLVTPDGDVGTPHWGHEQYIDVLYDFLGVEQFAHEETLPSGTAIILFTDIANSTALTERLGDAAFRTASRALDESVRAVIRMAGGTPVEGMVLGDGVMGIFSSAAQAIGAARNCAAAGGELPMHIGIHAGDVIREKDNVYGGAVNIASRICGLCTPGEILVSATVRDLARTSAGVTFEDRGEHALKGIADPVRVFAVRASE